MQVMCDSVMLVGFFFPTPAYSGRSVVIRAMVLLYSKIPPAAQGYQPAAVVQHADAVYRNN